MCLLSLSDNPKVADKDIVCYKFLDRLGPFRYMTPIREVKLWKFPYLKKIFVAKGTEEAERDPLQRRYVVGEGFIHTFAKMSDEYSRRGLHDVVLFRCIIPKGTKYFKSMDGSEYASREIVILNKVATWYNSK